MASKVRVVMTENRWTVLQNIAEMAWYRWPPILPKDVLIHMEALERIGYIERNGYYALPTRLGARMLGRWEGRRAALAESSRKGGD